MSSPWFADSREEDGDDAPEPYQGFAALGVTSVRTVSTEEDTEPLGTSYVSCPACRGRGVVPLADIEAEPGTFDAEALEQRLAAFRERRAAAAAAAAAAARRAPAAGTDN